jgi:lysozyme
VAPKTRRKGLIAIALVAIASVLVFLLLPAGDDEGVSAPDCEGPTVAGIDVSHHQNDISWKRVRRAGIRFAFIRTSDGLEIPDTRFTKNWAGAKRAGLLRGAYQYFRPDQDPTAQADALIRAIGTDHGELPPVIDVETDGVKLPVELASRVQTWVSRVREKLRVEPIVYTGPEFWRDKTKNADAVASQPLWIAHYTRGCPSVPAPWKMWTFWQYTDNGRISGIEGPVDLDYFRGTYDELLDFARAHAAIAARGSSK